MDESPALREEVQRLVAEMVRIEKDPAVLRMIVVLAGADQGFAEPAARRLVEGPPVPDAPGVGFAKIAENLWHHAQSVEDPALFRRLVATGRPLDLLRLSIQRCQSDLVEALEHAVAAGEVPVPVVGTVAMIVARRFPGQIGRAAAAVRGLSEEHRRTFLEHAVEASPELRVRIEDAFA